MKQKTFMNYQTPRMSVVEIDAEQAFAQSVQETTVLHDPFSENEIYNW